MRPFPPPPVTTSPAPSLPLPLLQPALQNLHPLLREPRRRRPVRLERHERTRRNPRFRRAQLVNGCDAVKSARSSCRQQICCPLLPVCLRGHRLRLRLPVRHHQRLLVVPALQARTPLQDPVEHQGVPALSFSSPGPTSAVSIPAAAWTRSGTRPVSNSPPPPAPPPARPPGSPNPTPAVPAPVRPRFSPPASACGTPPNPVPRPPRSPPRTARATRSPASPLPADASGTSPFPAPPPAPDAPSRRPASPSPASSGPPVQSSIPSPAGLRFP